MGAAVVLGAGERCGGAQEEGRGSGGGALAPKKNPGGVGVTPR